MQSDRVACAAFDFDFGFGADLAELLGPGPPEVDPELAAATPYANIEKTKTTTNNTHKRPLFGCGLFYVFEGDMLCGAGFVPIAHCLTHFGVVCCLDAR